MDFKGLKTKLSYMHYVKKNKGIINFYFKNKKLVLGKM